MAITKPPVIPSWAEAGDKVQPSNAEIQAGWPLSSIPPSRQRFNWLLNFLANGIRYFTRRGLPDYDAAETYMTGDRIIGDDGKTYRSLIDNNTAQTPSTSPTKWERWGFTFDEFLAGVATPPQFDNDTSLATTAFVQRALGSFSGVSVLNGATALAVADVGKNIILSGATPFATTLPATAGLPNGAAISIENNANVDCTVVRSGGDVISPNSSSAISTITIPAGTQITFVKVGTIWYAFGSGAAGYQSNFGSSLAASGYQKLPSGLIIQWGNLATSATIGQPVTVTYPVAFPNASFGNAVIRTATSVSADANTFAVDPSSNVSFVVRCQQAAATFRWIAIGY